MFDNFVVPNLLPAAPEIFLATMALAILMIDLLVKDSRRTVTFVLTQLTLIGCAAIQFATSTGEITYTFSNMFVDDLMSDLLKLFLYMTVVIVMFYSRGYVIDRESMNKGEYYVLALFATLGMMVMISANHFLTIYIGLELLSLSLYAMVAMNRDSVVSTEAAMKYFVLGALASGLLLYGMSMIYGATGTLEITGIAERLYGGGVNKSVLVFGLVFLVAGLAFKLGVCPLPYVDSRRLSGRPDLRYAVHRLGPQTGCLRHRHALAGQWPDYLGCGLAGHAGHPVGTLDGHR